MMIQMHNKDKTKNTHLNISGLLQRVYIDHKIWIATMANEIQIGVVDGPIYRLANGKLEEIRQGTIVYNVNSRSD